MIALTHMRTPNDIRLAENVPEVDLILGGHDHVYEKLLVRDGNFVMNYTECIADQWYLCIEEWN